MALKLVLLLCLSGYCQGLRLRSSSNYCDDLKMEYNIFAIKCKAMCPEYSDYKFEFYFNGTRFDSNELTGESGYYTCRVRKDDNAMDYTEITCHVEQFVLGTTDCSTYSWEPTDYIIIGCAVAVALAIVGFHVARNECRKRKRPTQTSESLTALVYK